MSATTLNVLLVEDSAADALLLQTALEADQLSNFKLTCAESLRQARGLLGSAPFDLILLDLGLPDSQGLATFEACQRLAPHLPIIVFSGNLDEQAAIRAVRSGAQDYLVKGQLAWNMAARTIRYALERHQFQATLRASEERYQQFISQSFEGIYRVEFNHPIETSLPVETQIDLIYAHAYLAECNQALAEMYHFPSVEALLKVRLVEMHGGPVHRATFRAFIENGYAARNFETLEQTVNGESIWFLNNAVGTVENGVLRCLWGTAIEISERKRIEAQLSESENRFSAAFQANPAAQLLTRLADGEILDANEAFCRLVETPRARLLGQTLDKLELRASPEARQKLGQELKTQQRVSNLEFEFRTRSGSTRTLLTSLQPLVVNGEACTIYGVLKKGDFQK